MPAIVQDRLIETLARLQASPGLSSRVRLSGRDHNDSARTRRGRHVLGAAVLPVERDPHRRNERCRERRLGGPGRLIARGTSALGAPRGAVFGEPSVAHPSQLGFFFAQPGSAHLVEDQRADDCDENCEVANSMGWRRRVRACARAAIVPVCGLRVCPVVHISTNRTVPARRGHLWLRPESWDGRRHMPPKPAPTPHDTAERLTSTRSSSLLAYPRAPCALRQAPPFSPKGHRRTACSTSRRAG